MKFVGAIWKLLVGIKDALVLILMILFFAGLYGALSARPAPVKDGVLDLNLNGSVVEQPARRQWVGRRRRHRVLQEYRLRDLVAALDKAKDDSRVKAVALDLDGFTGGGQTAIGDLADAVRRVRAAGKPVIAYGVGYTNDSYELASAASEIWLNPLGGSADHRAGRIEPLLQGSARQARSNRQRLSRRYLQVGGRTLHPQRHVARGASRTTWRSTRPSSRAGGRRSSRRGQRPTSTCSSTNMNGAVAAAGGDMAKAALAAGLVDQIGDRRDFEARLAELGGGDGQQWHRLQAHHARLLCRRCRRSEANRADRHRHHRRT